MGHLLPKLQVGIKIWDNWDQNPLFDWLSQKRPFLGGKNPLKPLSNHCMTSETPVIGLYGSFFTSITGWNQNLGRLGQKSTFWLIVPKKALFRRKKTLFRRKKSTETTVKPLYDIRDPRNWTLWVIFNLKYRMASKFGTIGTKIHFLTDCPKKDPF